MESETTTEVSTAVEKPKENAQVNISFTGTGWGFYKIFITNNILNIVTIGIYSAWAKVRTKRFFYGNTYANGHNFEFDASPVAILISRIIIIALLITAYVSEEFFDLYWQEIGLVSLSLLLVAPLALVRGRAFNSRHTIHRTVRFRYDIIYKPSYIAFLVFIIAIAPLWITLIFAVGTEETGDDDVNLTYFFAFVFSTLFFIALVPLINFLRHCIQINQLNFGKLKAKFTATLKQYYHALLNAAVITVSVMIIVYILGEIFISYSPSAFVLAVIAGLITIYYSLVANFSVIYWSSIIFNDGSYISTTLNWKSYLFRILIPNFLLILITIGILYPWARVRNWRYVANRVIINPSDETMAILDTYNQELTPLAGEFSDLDGFDFDFGVM